MKLNKNIKQVFLYNLLTLVILINSGLVTSQNPTDSTTKKQDSLIKELGTEEDTTKVTILNELAIEFIKR